MINIWKNLFFGEKPSSLHTASCLTASKTDLCRHHQTFEVRKREILCSSSSRYLIQGFTGEGRFGKVAKCVDLMTSLEVALKILKTEDSQVSTREIKMLEVVSILDPVKKNVVWFLEKFEHKGHTCLAFEMLDRSLLQLIEERNMEPLSPSEIRPIAQQLLTAFEALKSIGVVHADLKPDNVMLTNHLSEPFRVKLIDFGVSFTTSEMTQYGGMSIQPLGYRAPEVILGLPISEAIDMWGLGCLLAFLFLGKHLFAVNCEYQAMSGLVKILGQPADHLLSAGNNTSKFFKKNKHWDTPKWWLKTPIEYKLETGIAPKRWVRTIASLDDLITLYPEMQEAIEREDLRAFVSLLKGLQRTDPEKRITPEKALLHPFITMVHLEKEMDTSFYFEDSSENMLVCRPVDDPEEKLEKAHSAITFTNGTDSASTPTAGQCLATPRSSNGIINMPLSNAVEELPLKDIVAEETESEMPSTTLTSGTGTATCRSFESLTNMPPSNVRAAATGVEATADSTVVDSADSQGAVVAAEQMLPNDGSPDEGPSVKVKNRRLKRNRKLFGRAIMTLFVKKQLEE